MTRIRFVAACLASAVLLGITGCGPAGVAGAAREELAEQVAEEEEQFAALMGLADTSSDITHELLEELAHDLRGESFGTPGSIVLPSGYYLYEAIADRVELRVVVVADAATGGGWTYDEATAFTCAQLVGELGDGAATKLSGLDCPAWVGDEYLGGRLPDEYHLDELSLGG